MREPKDQEILKVVIIRKTLYFLGIVFSLRHHHQSLRRNKKQIPEIMNLLSHEEEIREFSIKCIG